MFASDRFGSHGLASAGFGSHRLVRTVAAAGVAGLAALGLSACTDDRPDLDFQGTLAVGVLLPQTGGLDYLAPAQQAALELAASEINEAGGVWGSEVTLRYEDEGGSEDGSSAVAGAEALIDAGVNAVVGPVTTAATLNVIEPLRDAGILQVSPASPGIVLDEHPARELFFRTQPSDVLQGRVLAAELVSDQRQQVAIVARDDAYGQGLAGLLREVYEGSGDRTIVAEVTYDPEDLDAAAELAELAEAQPDAVVVISFEEGAEILTALADAQLAPADGVGWYLTNGNLADYSGDHPAGLPEGFLEGAKGTAPTLGGDRSDFHDRLAAHVAEAGDAELTTRAYDAEAYDALILLALGAITADTDDPAAIREAMLGLSRDPGTECTDFVGCLDLIREGEEINYSGQSGPVDWTDTGDLRQGAIGVYAYGPDNSYSLVRVDVGRR